MAGEVFQSLARPDTRRPGEGAGTPVPHSLPHRRRCIVHPPRPHRARDTPSWSGRARSDVQRTDGHHRPTRTAGVHVCKASPDGVVGTGLPPSSFGHPSRRRTPDRRLQCRRRSRCSHRVTTTTRHSGRSRRGRPFGPGPRPDPGRGRRGRAQGLVALHPDLLRPARRQACRGSRRAGARAVRRGVRAAEAAALVDPRPGPPLHDVGLHHPADGLHRGLRRAVRRGLPHPADRALGGPGLPAGLHRDHGADLDHRLRDHAHPAGPGAPRADLPLLRLPHRRRVADPLPHLLRRLDAVRLPRRLLRGRQPALRVGRLGLDRHRVPLLRAVAGDALRARDRLPHAPHRRGADLPRGGALLEAPPHLHRADQRLGEAHAQGARGPAAPRARGQADRLRGSARGGVLRSRQDRGLHLEGHARLRDLHRVRSLPEPVPGVEHRQAALAEAADHGPARPHVREGAVHDRRQGHAGRGCGHPGRHHERRR